MNERSFKIGDRVRIIRYDNSLAKSLLGEVTTVISGIVTGDPFNRLNGRHLVDIKVDGYKEVYALPEQLELIKDSKDEEELLEWVKKTVNTPVNETVE